MTTFFLSFFLYFRYCLNRGHLLKEVIFNDWFNGTQFLWPPLILTILAEG